MQAEQRGRSSSGSTQLAKRRRTRPDDSRDGARQPPGHDSGAQGLHLGARGAPGHVVRQHRRQAPHDEQHHEPAHGRHEHPQPGHEHAPHARAALRAVHAGAEPVGRADAAAAAASTCAGSSSRGLSCST
jgi:hypothetical protein